MSEMQAVVRFAVAAEAVVREIQRLTHALAETAGSFVVFRQREETEALFERRYARQRRRKQRRVREDR